MNLLDIHQQNGFNPVRVSGKDGGEYASPCPACGGTDRFHIWPGIGGNDGSYWCRGCKAQGDAIQYLRNFQGLSYTDACRTLGVEPKQRYSGGASGNGNKRRQTTGSSNPTSRPSAPAWSPRNATTPPYAWQVKAASLVTWAEQQLWSEAGADMRGWLYDQRRLSDDTIKAAHLGWMPTTYWLKRMAWGLSDVIKESGKRKKLWIPGGLVIPLLDAEGRVLSVRIRRPDPGDGPRYYTLPGSSMRPMVCRLEQYIVIVVESELDAILIAQEAADLVTAVALGSATMRPDSETAALLAAAEKILLALDSDDAGGRETYRWWLQHFDRARDWPCAKGKDPTEMMLVGISIRTWIEAALLPDEETPTGQDGDEAGSLAFLQDRSETVTAEVAECNAGDPAIPEPTPSRSAEGPAIKCYDCAHFSPGRFLKLPGRCGGMPHDGCVEQSALDPHRCDGFKFQGR
jgi:DNA primase